MCGVSGTGGPGWTGGIPGVDSAEKPVCAGADTEGLGWTDGKPGIDPAEMPECGIPDTRGLGGDGSVTGGPSWNPGK